MSEEKRTFASVTEQLCSCGFLEGEAKSPDSPIMFIQETNEYALVSYDKNGEMKANFRIFHCLFCGGVTPESLSQNLFAVISSEELQRLHEMTQNIKTLDDAIQYLGLPNQDNLNGVTSETRERDSVVPKIESFRSLRYDNLSATATILIIDYHKDRVHFEFYGKFIGQSAVTNDS